MTMLWTTDSLKKVNYQIFGFHLTHNRELAIYYNKSNDSRKLYAWKYITYKVYIFCKNSICVQHLTLNFINSFRIEFDFNFLQYFFNEINISYLYLKLISIYWNIS